MVSGGQVVDGRVTAELELAADDVTPTRHMLEAVPGNTVPEQAPGTGFQYGVPGRVSSATKVAVSQPSKRS